MQRSRIFTVRRAVPAGLMAAVLIMLPNWSTSPRARASTPKASKAVTLTYTNPLKPAWKNVGAVNTCGDPAIIHSQTGKDHNWYAYCTSDRLNDQDSTLHYIPTLKSPDLVHWKYIGDAVLDRAPYSAPDGSLWAPDIHYFNGKYYMYFTDPDVVNSAGQTQASAIGVMTSKTAHGPWTYSPDFVVEPHDAPCCAGSHMWTFDPTVVTDNGQKYIFYGSYFGGIQARKLSADGLHSDPATQTQITIDNQYEGSFVFKHGGYWYLFNSATNCCNGKLTGYVEFVNRSKDILGPYVDANGKPALDARSGGSIVISQNGNQWVGTGGASVFNDAAGKTWILYHGVDRHHPYLGPTTTTKRQPLLEPIKWVNGWPEANGGNWTSDAKQKAPAAQKGEKDSIKLSTFQNQQPGSLIANISDDFTSTTLGSQWSWIRPPASPIYTLGTDGLTMDIQHTDLQPGAAQPSLLTEPAPTGNYIVETKVSTDVPATGCCFNYAQPALYIYKGDGNYVKLSVTPLFGTRFIEFGNETHPVPSTSYPYYGNTQIGPPADTTWLRIAKTGSGKKQVYRAYYSLDGTNWVAGGVWTHNLGPSPKIAIAGVADQDATQNFHATFSYVHVYNLS